MKILFLILILALGVQFPSCADAAEINNPVDGAYYVCVLMEHTGLTTSCEVKGLRKSVDVHIDTNGGEARKICAGVAEMMTSKTAVFNGAGWKLRIFSPYSGDEPIAVCPLR